MQFIESMESTELEAGKSLDFQKYWLGLKRHWLPATGLFGCAIIAASAYASTQQPVYEAQGKILFKKNQITAATSITATGESQQTGELSHADPTSSPLNTEVEIIHSISLAQKAIAAINLRSKQGELVKPQQLVSQVTVKIIPATDVIQLSYQSHDAREAAAVVNALMKAYVENNTHSNRAAAIAATEFITEQLPKTKEMVHQADMALRRFKERNQVVALDKEADSAVSTEQEFQKGITDTQAALVDANTRSANLHAKVGMNSQEAVAINSLNQSSGVQDALKEFQKGEGQLALERTRFQDDHPTIQALKDKQEALKALLKERVEQNLGDQQLQVSDGNLQMGDSKEKLADEFVKSEVDRVGLASRLTYLSNAEAVYKQRANSLPRLEQEQRELTRQLDAAQSTYEDLLKKFQELRITENQSMGNASIIEPALVPGAPTANKKSQILGMGGAAGIALAAAIVFLLEASDKYIKTLKEAREMFGYTLLGSIPYFGKKKGTSRRKEQEGTIPELPVRDTPRSPISEAYRMLQANLRFVSPDKEIKVIVVTSSVPKEGKSSVSANLAVAMTELGQRVLLLDADIRKPFQHHIWQLPNAVGLSDIIVEQAEFRTAVKRVMPNLDVLTSGAMPPNPVALINSKRMSSLIESLSETYDAVIIDAPPLVVVADALTLGKMADGVLLVARPEIVDSASATTAKESLQRSGQNVLGLVVNGVVVENESDSYFYYAKEYSNDEYSSPQATVSSGRNGRR